MIALILMACLVEESSVTWSGTLYAQELSEMLPLEQAALTLRSTEGTQLAVSTTPYSDFPAFHSIELNGTISSAGTIAMEITAPNVIPMVWSTAPPDVSNNVSWMGGGLFAQSPEFTDALLQSYASLLPHVTPPQPITESVRSGNCALFGQFLEPEVWAERLIDIWLEPVASESTSATSSDTGNDASNRKTVLIFGGNEAGELTSSTAERIQYFVAWDLPADHYRLVVQHNAAAEQIERIEVSYPPCSGQVLSGYYFALPQ